MVSKGGVGIFIVLVKNGRDDMNAGIWVFILVTIGALSGIWVDKAVVITGGVGISIFVVESTWISPLCGRDDWVDVKIGGLGIVDGIIGLLSLDLTVDVVT